MDFLINITAAINITFYLFLFNYIIFRPGSAIYCFFYRQVEHNMAKDRRVFYPIHCFHIFLYTVYLFRFLYIIYEMSRPHGQKHMTKYNFFFNFFKSISTEKDYFYVLIFIMFFIFVLLIEPNIFFSRTDTITWLKYDDLVVKNCDIYQKCLKQKNKKSIHKKKQSFSGKHKSSNVEFNFDQTLFEQTKLPYFPTFSVDNRIKFIRILHILDKGCAIQVLSFSKFFYI